MRLYLTAPSTSIIAYNGDSPRGWNDPPTFAFSGQKGGGSRPKLDLRKRVSHHQALHGTNTPPNPPTTPTTSSYAAGSEVSDRMASLSLHSSPMNPGNASPIPHNTTPPMHSKMSHTPHTTAPSVPLYTPPTTHSYHTHDRSNSLPAILMPSPSPVPPGVPHVSSSSSLSTDTVPDIVKSPSPVPISDTPTHLGQPLFHLKDHSFEPVKTHNESGVRSTADLGDHLDDHTNGNHHPQIFHPTPYTAVNGQPASTNTAPLPPSHISPSPGLTTAPPAVHAPHVPATTPAMSSQPGIPTTTPFPGGLGHPPPSITPPLAHFTPAITNSPHVGHVTPPPSANTLPPFPVGHRTPTPTPPTQPKLSAPAPGSLSTGSTPRCLSPEENGVDEDTSEMSDEEGLKATMDALNDVIQKCHLKKQQSDDIAKRLKVMSKMWMEGKLGKTVKNKMIKLAQALDDGRGEDAHHIHVTIIVDHVTEVNQWIVAVKRLISLVRHQPQSTATS